MIQELEKQVLQIEEEVRRLEENSIDNVASEILLSQWKRRKMELLHSARKDMKAWDRVYLSRHPARVKSKEWIEFLFDEVFYLHGDRYYGDDKTMIGAIAMFGEIPVTVIGTNKGRNLQENMTCNFGMSHPEGYRKALRLMKQAEKFKRPIVTIVDTPGAYPGIGAEERGQGEAIARNLMEMSDLQTPIISLITGEGGSGGALALSLADRILMLENATFSVLSPEGFASILWKDSKLAAEASEKMKMTAQELFQMKLIDQVIEEDISFVKEGFRDTMLRTKEQLKKALEEVMNLSTDELLDQRYKKYRTIGCMEGMDYGI